MPPELFHMNISADGKLLGDCPSAEIKPGNSIRLVINGNQMTGGADSTTLLGKNQDFLPASRQFKLTSFEPLPDGTCELLYESV